jgi:hydrogenase maturation protein HypF
LGELQGVRFHINGVVQGVGFRPFVYGLAARLHLLGWVRNSSAGVDIELDGLRSDLENFIQTLKTDPPPLAHIDEVLVHWQPPVGFKSFEIIHSEAIPDAFQPISPDVCTCPDCLSELFDPKDRRFRYPFINCTNCGPRFTIIKDVPYDRPKTTMASFELCPDCEAEYQNPLDRRFHAQPVACPKCGPKIWLETPAGENKIACENEAAILETQKLLGQGNIIAIKGLGGFHLACDANNASAVAELRRRKLRVDKPFALMLPDLDTVDKVCYLDDLAAQLLGSHARPIVLLEKKPGLNISSETAPGQKTLGVMLPYTPLHYLLFDTHLFNALVMTSGNVSEEPIVTDNEDARTRLAAMADAFLMHDRDIYIRCDDSVVRVFENSILPIRRSRGYAPYPVHLQYEPPPLLACGAQLKNTFCITHGNYAFLSHHIGDLENFETLESFETGIAHFERLFRVKIKALAHDLHPDYLATRYALKRSILENLPAIAVQHHHAHIVSCMVENKLNRDQPVIGVAFDGTGYGEDGTIWGGEFLIADFASFKREFHLEPITLPGGDLAVREPWRVAYSWLEHTGLSPEAEFLPLGSILNDQVLANLFKRQLKTGINSPLTSSMGRLFDAASALAGVRTHVNYEGQAAIEFEALLDPAETGCYYFELGSNRINPDPLFQDLVRDVKKGFSKGKIAARFHNGIAEMTLQVCQVIRKQSGLTQVALSGGVWQNLTLLKKTLTRLRANGFQVYIHGLVPPNDGGLALGQAVVAATRLKNDRI